MRRTKIVATLGPATETPGMIRALIKAGVDVFRLNQSHGERDWHERALAGIREEAAALGAPVAVMVDLQGPKIRISRVAGGRIMLRKGAMVDIAAGDGIGDEKTLYTPLPQLVSDVRAGDRVLLDDGSVVLEVARKVRGRARARVLVGGPLSDNKGINLPGVKLSVPSVTERDIDNLRWAAAAGVEYVAVSFVRCADDVAVVRGELHRLKSPIKVIAKIEKPEAVDRIDEIADVSDGLMVARGDLGVEMNLEDVPVAQMRIINSAHRHDIPVIVATQMLESMLTNPRPTRAEVSDVAGAIFGSTDAVMLSGETAVGRWPVETVRQMAAIAERAETHLVESGELEPVFSPHPVFAVADAVCHGAYAAARDLGAGAVFVATASGRTALLFSKYRFAGTLVGASHDEAAVRRMALYWGIKPVHVARMTNHHHLLQATVRAALAGRLVARGETIVFVAGSPLVRAGGTNMLLVHRIADARKGADAGSVAARVPAGRIELARDACVGCGECVGICPAGVYNQDAGKVTFDRARLKACLGDWLCRDACPAHAITVTPIDGGAR